MTRCGQRRAGRTPPGATSWQGTSGRAGLQRLPRPWANRVNRRRLGATWGQLPPWCHLGTTATLCHLGTTRCHLGLGGCHLGTTATLCPASLLSRVQPVDCPRVPPWPSQLVDCPRVLPASSVDAHGDLDLVVADASSGQVTALLAVATARSSQPQQTFVVLPNAKDSLAGVVSNASGQAYNPGIGRPC